MEIEFSASDAIRQALCSIGQTEDVKFSPDNRQLILVGLHTDKLLVVDVDINGFSAGKSITLTGFMAITSPSFKMPHALCFLDNETIIVANREAGASILRLPPRGTGVKSIALTALNTIGVDPADHINTPDCVSVSPLGQNLYEVLICNTWSHYVTRHIVDEKANFSISSSEILLRKHLNLPDCVDISHGGQWAAISNHNTHSVFLYEKRPGLNRDSEPTVILPAVKHPHGVRFSQDNSFIIATSASSPFINIYTNYGRSWKGMLKTMCSVRVMDQDAFLRGHINPVEGGAKGIDITNDMKLFVITCDQKRLAFFDLEKIMATQRVDKCAPFWRRYLRIAYIAYSILHWNLVNIGAKVIVYIQCLRVIVRRIVSCRVKAWR